MYRNGLGVQHGMHWQEIIRIRFANLKLFVTQYVHELSPHALREDLRGGEYQHTPIGFQERSGKDIRMIYRNGIAADFSPYFAEKAREGAVGIVDDRRAAHAAVIHQDIDAELQEGFAFEVRQLFLKRGSALAADFSERVNIVEHEPLKLIEVIACRLEIPEKLIEYLSGELLLYRLDFQRFQRYLEFFSEARDRVLRRFRLSLYVLEEL